MTPPPPVTSWYLGLDLGQRRDYSAIATLSLEWSNGRLDHYDYEWKFEPRLVVRDLERFPLGTSYLFYPDAVKERVDQLNTVTPPSTGRRAYLIVDAGGPGLPVIDELRRHRLGADKRPLTITSGNQPGQSQSGSATVPRKILLSTLIILLDAGRLVAPPGVENWETLCEEMLDLNASTSQPNKTSSHDDIVMAVALAAWHATQVRPELLPAPKRSKIHWSPSGNLF